MLWPINSKFRHIEALLGLLLAALIISSCQEVDPGRGEIRLGLITYTDEHSQAIGIPARNAAEMAVAEINSKGGISIAGEKRPVKLLVEGIASSPQNAVAAMRKLINRDNVSSVVGLNYSLDAIPAGAFAEKAHVPFISPMSTHTLTTSGRQYVFRMSFVDELQGAAMARYAYHDLSARRAAILYNRSDPYSSGITAVFSSVFSQLGGVIVAKVSHADDVDSYDTHVKQIREKNPDVLYLPGFSADVVQQVREVRRQDVKVQLLGADGWNSQDLAANPDFDGAYMSSHWNADVTRTSSNRFVADYGKRFGMLPSSAAALTYDAVKMLQAAISSCASPEGESVRRALVEMGPFDGVTGAIDFVDSGDPVKGVVFLQLQGGKVLFEKVVQRSGEEK